MASGMKQQMSLNRTQDAHVWLVVLTIYLSHSFTPDVNSQGGYLWLLNIERRKRKAWKNENGLK